VTQSFVQRVLRLTLVSLASLFVVLTHPAAAAPGDNWPAYLKGPDHHSYQPSATAITTSNVSTLAPDWNWKPAPPTKPDQPGNLLFASPTVYGGRVFIGANTGVFYALNESTGAVVWKRNVGYVPSLTCYRRGVTSTATVAVDPTRGYAVVYVAGGDGYLYALRASDGSVLWRSLVVKTGVADGKNAAYNWSSPTLFDDRIYVGMSSHCDVPLIRAGVRAFAQSTGQRIGTYFSMPQGVEGGSVWSSVAANPDGVWVTTGNAGTSGPGDAVSIVRLHLTTLARLDKWTVPTVERVPDSDFGASPTLFTASPGGVEKDLVGACNKNGFFYTWDQATLSSGPVWKRRIGAGSSGGAICIAAAVWDDDRGRLFVGSNQTTVNGTPYPGAVRRLDPATGKSIWDRGLGGGPVMGTPTLNGSGVLAVGTYNELQPSANRVYLVNAATGVIIRQLSVGSEVFSQPVFAGPYLFVATRTGGLTAYSPA